VNKCYVRRCFSKAHSKIVYCQIVKINLKILFREENLSCKRHINVSRPLCVTENIFQGMRNPGIGFVRIQDGLMAKTNREEKSSGTPRRGRVKGGGTARRGREKFTLAATLRECTPGRELCSSCGYRPSDADRG